MPTINKFYGLVIRMYFDDKHVPHFHVSYAEHRALIAIRDGSLLLRPKLEQVRESGISIQGDKDARASR